MKKKIFQANVVTEELDAMLDNLDSYAKENDVELGEMLRHAAANLDSGFKGLGSNIEGLAEQMARDDLKKTGGD